MTGQVDAPDIYNAQLARDHNAVALRIEVSTQDQGFQVLTVPAENLIIRRSDGHLLSPEAFLKLGAEYWTAFADRRKSVPECFEHWARVRF